MAALIYFPNTLQCSFTITHRIQTPHSLCMTPPELTQSTTWASSPSYFQNLSKQNYLLSFYNLSALCCMCCAIPSQALFLLTCWNYELWCEFTSIWHYLSGKKTFLLLTVITSRVLYYKSIIQLTASTLVLYEDHSYPSVTYVFYKFMSSG